MSKNKKNITSMKQIDGKIHKTDAEPIFEPVTIAQVLGDTGLSKYSTLDPIEYSNKLNEMNLAELRSHATTVGIIPRDVTMERLKRQLLAEFNRYISSYQKPKLKTNNNIQPTDEILKIMSILK